MLSAASPAPSSGRVCRAWWQRALAFSPWRDAVVSSSPERGLPPIADELTSVLAFHGQRAFALGTVIALAECSRAPSPVPDCPALFSRAVACSAGGDGGRRSPGGIRSPVVGSCSQIKQDCAGCCPDCKQNCRRSSSGREPWSRF